MPDKHDFLVEIGTEELPPRALKNLSQKFADGIRAGLDDAALSHGELTVYATPRRLAVRVQGLLGKQVERELELRGPPAKIAFDKDGKPTRAAEAFAQKCGVEVSQLQKIETDKGAWLIHRGTEKGKTAASLLPNIVTAALNALPIPKRMRWGTKEEEFVRPVHWVVLMLDSHIVPANFFGLPSGRQSVGHRFHAPEAFDLGSPAEYEESLLQRHVIASFEKRQAMISEAVAEAAARLGGTAVSDAALLDEVTALVEWPVAVSAAFDERFLALPEEV
ncbi:MAG: glycine--tRNA ligase subunit beta, partial [Gammaproteobacteria bacterium]|nr:glycine--tRNA ligase subunit beta [Gammaproteobacteria bacterium]